MKFYLLLIAILLSITSCKRTYTYICNTPQIILQQSGYDVTEWDTIITRVYHTDFQRLEVADTFIANDITNELLITPDLDGNKSFQIFLSSVNRTHYVRDIIITGRTIEVQKGAEAECYHDISFTVDEEVISGLSTATGTVYATLNK